jgi:uncharacterized protein
VQLPNECELLRIFIGQDDKYESGPLAMYAGRPRYEVIVREARRRGLAGATVLQGSLGYGANSRIRGGSNEDRVDNFLHLSHDLPIVIEIIDKPERIESFLPDLQNMIGEGLITVEKVRVVVYRPSTKAKS